MTPLGQDAFRAAAAPLDGHDALAAKGATIGAAAAGHNAKAAGAIDMIGGGLQIGIAIHLKEMVGRPGQTVEVSNRCAIGVVVNLAVAGLVGDAQTILEILILRMQKG